MSEHINTLPGHPDQAFDGKKEKGAIRVLISEEIAGLAASLAVPVQDGRYEPDAFVRAIRARHDQLVEVTEKLKRQNAEQKARELDLRKREAAVREREERVSAVETLTPRGNASWWKL